MENNIFENAYFGKPYKTRDGKKAIYLRKNEFSNHILSLGFREVVIDWENGKELNGIPGNSSFDIVSEWVEEIDIDKLQAKCLAEDIENGVMKDDLGHHYPNDDQSWIQGYAIGFYKGFKQANNHGNI